MKILIFGDVYGRIGRKGLKQELPKLVKKYNPDFVIANIDNITSGRGAIEKHIIEMNKLGVDIMAGGDHIVDNYSKIKDYLDKKDSNLIRFANFNDPEFAGVGHKIIEKKGKKLLFIHLQGQVFMNHRVKNPFYCLEDILSKYSSDYYDGVIVDFHKETTAEGYGLVNFFDGKVSFIYGTHTHIQTNDDIILDNGTGYINDVGMNGPLKSVIGADFNSVRHRFLSGISSGKLEQSLDENYLVSGVFVEIGDDKKCKIIEKIKIKSK